MLQKASTRNIAFIHLCYGIYASIRPAIFVRKKPVVNSTALTPPPSPGGARGLADQHNSIDIVLTSELDPGSTGIVHIGEMEVDPSDGKIAVAVKLAFTEYDKSTLEHEYRIYSHLQSKNVPGIPIVFGIFKDDQPLPGGEGPYALITSFAGSTISGMTKDIRPQAKYAHLFALPR
jgi:hypothetical protein